MKNIVIWGTGVIGRSLYYNLCWGGYKVKYFVDNSQRDVFYNCKVLRPTKENCSKYLVVVASNLYYEDIAIQLMEYGLEELKDYIPYQALGKKIVILHGNCHIGIIKSYLNTSKSFKDKYYIYSIPMIQHNKKGYIKEHLLSNCDVFIYQDIQADNQYDIRLSEEYLLPKVRNMKICIPNIYGMGKIFYPQAKKGKEDCLWSNPSGREIPGGLFNFRDENIDSLWRKGERKIEKIVEYLRGPIYDKENVKNEFEHMFSKMEEREKHWDVKILEYIKQNYKKQQMFYEPAHPCNNILRKISEEILVMLDIDINELQEIEESFGVSEMPIYKCVKEALELKFERKYIRNVPPIEESKLTEKDMDLKEYCREYCYWCFEWLD